MSSAPSHDPAPPHTSGPILNLPNFLTSLRILAVPVLIWLLASEGDSARFWATAVFLIAALTDLVDGAVARRRNQITSFGKLADPIADKALIGTALIGLSLLGELSWWFTIIILIREIGITVMRMWVLSDGVIPASRGGKLKTLAQVIAISMYLLAPADISWWNGAQLTVMSIAVALTLVTGIDYVLEALRLRKAADKSRATPNSTSTPPPTSADAV
ncbi:MAG: CDP-diacylglycerol--glycerol-3-phosphate 3-phosphatidyltransferase [Actinomycetota bacterium]|nr:CDP-diacylglycerol--glycerol-3-phosphate 3-phosphatidyltransferase [Actinomycetota bacterium]